MRHLITAAAIAAIVAGGWLPVSAQVPTFDPAPYVSQGDAYNCPDFASQADAQAVLRADPTDPEKDPKKIKFAQALADSARNENDAAKAIDGKAETGWQADPGAISEPHAILFLPADPVTISTNSE